MAALRQHIPLGSMDDRIAGLDWAGTPLGCRSGWPQSLQTLVQIMLASSQPMFVAWGPERTLIYNDGYSSILGTKHPAALGADFLDVWAEIRGDLLPIVQQAYGGVPVQMDDIQLVMHRKGYPEETHFSFFYSPVRDASGAVEGFFCACNETTEHVKAQKALRASEARLRSVLSNMAEAFVLFDRHFVVIDLNEEALRLDGRQRHEIVGRTLWHLHPELHDSELGAFYRESVASGTPGEREQHYVWPDGRRMWVEVRAYPAADGLAVFFRDVTARRHTETAAAAAAERVQLALDAGAIVGTWVWDVPTNHFIADERFARSFGLDPALCRSGLALEQVVVSIHPDDLATVKQAMAEAMKKGGPYRCEYRVRQYDGVYRWIEASGHVDLDPSGSPVRFPGVLMDIELRRRTEEERDQATALLRTFIEAVPGVVYAKDREGRMLVANRGTAELIGKPFEAFVGRTDAEFLHDKVQAQAVMATDRRIMETGEAQQVEEEVWLADGTPAYWLSTKAPMRDAHGRVVGLIGTSVDITERKRGQERARVEAETLDVLNRTGTLLAGELELDALLQTVTDAATKLAGAQFGALFYNGVNAAGEAYVLYTLSGAPRENFERFGQPRLTPLFEPTFRGGPPVRIDDVHEDARFGLWGPHFGMPAGHLPVRSYLAVSIVSRRGEVIGGLFFGHADPGVFTERSERLVSGIAAQAAVAIDNARLYAEAQRAAEERRQLLESERAARSEAERASTLKDQFLATLSHELRTPLSAILGWTHILRRKLPESDPSLQKGIEVIERSTRVQTQLIEDLLDMSRITSGKLKLEIAPVAPVTFVQAAVEALGPAAAAARVAVRLIVQEPGDILIGDAARLQQVVWNLISNAIKFSRPDSEVLVKVTSEANFAVIAVEDAGEGIAPEFLPHVFERFRQADGSTTRRHGGLGLGLAIVRHLVELHGGCVSASSAGCGRGARFEVRLPIVQQGQAQPAKIATLQDVDLSGVRVLVVDDEPDVLDLLARVFRDAGADVALAAGAEEALAVYDQRHAQVVISDIGMPGIDGYELISRLRKRSRRPPRDHVMAVALTAFARTEDREKALASGFDFYLSKPVEPQQLLRTVDALLQEASTAGRRL